MTRLRMPPRFCVLVAFAAIGASSFVAQAEQPPSMSPSSPQLKPAPPPRSKPQIIYRLPRSSNYSAALHSQAKTQSSPLPIDNNVSPSLQMSRAAANEAAARAQQQQTAPKANSSRQQRIKPSKLRSNQPQMRKHGSGKGPGPGASRGKGRKK